MLFIANRIRNYTLSTKFYEGNRKINVITATIKKSIYCSNRNADSATSLRELHVEHKLQKNIPQLRINGLNDFFVVMV